METHVASDACEYKSRVPCSLLLLHQLQSIMFKHLYHVIDVPMNRWWLDRGL